MVLIRKKWMFPWDGKIYIYEISLKSAKRFPKLARMNIVTRDYSCKDTFDASRSLSFHVHTTLLRITIL